jgi:Na+/proline symporter
MFCHHAGKFWLLQPILTGLMIFVLITSGSEFLGTPGWMISSRWDEAQLFPPQ